MAKMQRQRRYDASDAAYYSDFRTFAPFLAPFLAALLTLGVALSLPLPASSRWGVQHCPANARLVGASPPSGFERYCMREHDGDFLRHGAYRSWYDNGRKLVFGR